MKKLLFSVSIAVLSVSSLYAQNIHDSLQAHFPFNHNINDVTKHAHHLGVNGGISPYVFVTGVDSALSFNGTDRLTSINKFDASSFSQMAISVWIKTNTNSSSDQFVVQGAGIGFGLALQASTGKVLSFFGGSSTSAYIGKNPVNDGAWHNIVMQSSGSTTSLYVDGVFDGSIAESLFPASGGSDNKLYVGATTFNTRSFTGLMNDLRIYNRTLTSNEIDTLFLKSLSVPKLIAGKSASFSIFPNPTSNGRISLHLENTDPGSTIRIVDITGRQIWQGQSHSEQVYEIDYVLNSGVYMVSVESKGSVWASRKLVVQ